MKRILTVSGAISLSKIVAVLSLIGTLLVAYGAITGDFTCIVCLAALALWDDISYLLRRFRA